MPPKHVAIVTCSTRTPRLNPTITQYVYEILSADPTIPTKKHKRTPSTSSTATTSTHEEQEQQQQEEEEEPDTDPRHITLKILDLAAQQLPLYDETIIPASLPAQDPTPHYTRAHTRAWSSVVRSFDAFIFVTPQYNWSIPASLKNALDYLFHEWKGKPAGIVSYGGRGGAKAADHLRGVLTGLRMRVVGTSPGLAVRFTGLPVGSGHRNGHGHRNRRESVSGSGSGRVEEELVKLDERDVEGWRDAGVQGMMRNMGMELVCELDKSNNYND